MADENRFFQIEIITPDRVFYRGEGTMIEFNTVEGEIGVYRNHIPLTTVLSPGVVTITIHGEEDQKKRQCIQALLRYCQTG